MSKQLHNNFTDNQVKSLLKSYLDKKTRLVISYKCFELKAPSTPRTKKYNFGLAQIKNLVYLK